MEEEAAAEEAAAEEAVAEEDAAEPGYYIPPEEMEELEKRLQENIDPIAS